MSETEKNAAAGVIRVEAERDRPRLADRVAPEGLVIRRLSRLEPEMLSSLEEYGREALGDSALDRWMLPVIAGYGLLYVGVAGATEVVGAAEIIRCLQDGDLYLEGFYIRPRFQGWGYGSQMLTAIRAILRGDGYKRLLATVDPENLDARRLYEKTGFTRAGFLPDHYGPGRDRLLLSLNLQND